MNGKCCEYQSQTSRMNANEWWKINKNDAQAPNYAPIGREREREKKSAFFKKDVYGKTHTDTQTKQISI